MPLVFALAATIIIEYYLQLRWSPGYFVTGLRLFNERRRILDSTCAKVPIIVIGGRLSSDPTWHHRIIGTSADGAIAPLPGRDAPCASAVLAGIAVPRPVRALTQSGSPQPGHCA